MRIALCGHDTGADLEVAGLSADARLGDLIAHVWPSAEWVVVDGVRRTLDEPLADVVRDGSLLDIDGREPVSSERAVVGLHSLTGPMAGHTWMLEPGRYVVGCAGSIRLEAVDALLEIEADRSARWNGEPFPPGALAAGPHRLRVAPIASEATAHPPGPRSLFNRPPRQLPQETVDPLLVPVRSSVSGKPRRISPLMLVVPLFTGIGMALLFGRMLFLAFALLGPITTLGSTIDDRRRRRRDTREADEQFSADVSAFEEVVVERSKQVAVRRFADHPSTSELLVMATGRSMRLWERRSGHADHLQAVVGFGRATWQPPLAGGPLTPEVAERLDPLRRLPDAPVVAALAPGHVLGIAGDRGRGRRLAADVVCQLATTHGPADLRVAVITDDPGAWDWAKWLPHTAPNQLSDLRMLASEAVDIGSLAATLRRSRRTEEGPCVVLVVDHRGVDEEHARMIRECFAGLGRPTSGIVTVDAVEQLPGSCTDVLELGPTNRHRRPHAGLTLDRVEPVGVEPAVAAQLARALAPLDDPEAAMAGGALPEVVRALDLLELSAPTAEGVVGRWNRSGSLPRIAVPVGMTEAGPFEIDLVSDGPHALMAGTTGSGKSELLRTLVAGLAATVSPDHLTFVLVDYKGGAAFDACADLPHVVGLVTDLDEHLGSRALTSLEAELHHREEQLRRAGVADIDEYWRRRRGAPLPRLAVIVDEFATLAKELPEFMDALVDIAQRGRSLGVHMLLATQRPSGVVKDSIRANTNLRISLRVQTAADSNDVLTSPEAAALPRSRPGRGYARLGPGELVPFQTALSTVAPSAQGPVVQATPFRFAMRRPQRARLAPAADGVTDLTRLVGAIVEAARVRGGPRPRRPWTDPLPPDVELEQLPEPSAQGEAVIGLADQPHRQQRAPWSWTPHDDGNLLLVGTSGWGPTQALITIAASLADHLDPDQVHLYGIDHGPGDLGSIAVLPHVGSVVPPADVDRQRRLLRHLRALVEARRRSPGGPTTVLLLDGLAGFKAAFEDIELAAYRDMLQEIAATGPQHGVFVAASADQNRIVPSSLAGAMSTRLVFNLADSLEYGMLGIRGTVPELPRRRAIDPVTQEHIQIGRADASHLARIAARASLTTRTPEPILSLPTHVDLVEVVDAGGLDDGWRFPIGLDEETLTAATISAYPGDHLLVAGPGRSGRSTVLALVAAAARKLAPEARVLAVAPRPSPLRLDPAVDTVARSIDELGHLDPAGPTVLLVDDAEDVDDGGLFSDMIERRSEQLVVVAAGRTDALRGAHRHWTKGIRSGRRGIILEPFDSADGDVLGIRLPRSARPSGVKGRAYLVDGATVRLVQVASP